MRPSLRPQAGKQVASFIQTRIQRQGATPKVQSKDRHHMSQLCHCHHPRSSGESYITCPAALSRTRARRWPLQILYASFSTLAHPAIFSRVAVSIEAPERPARAGNRPMHLYSRRCARLLLPERNFAINAIILALSFAIILVGSELFTNGVEWAGHRSAYRRGCGRQRARRGRNRLAGDVHPGGRAVDRPRFRRAPTPRSASARSSAHR